MASLGVSKPVLSLALYSDPSTVLCLESGAACELSASSCPWNPPPPPRVVAASAWWPQLPGWMLPRVKTETCGLGAADPALAPQPGGFVAVSQPVSGSLTQPHSTSFCPSATDPQVPAPPRPARLSLQAQLPGGRASSAALPGTPVCKSRARRQGQAWEGARCPLPGLQRLAPPPHSTRQRVGCLLGPREPTFRCARSGWAALRGPEPCGEGWLRPPTLRNEGGGIY